MRRHELGRLTPMLQPPERLPRDPARKDLSMASSTITNRDGASFRIDGGDDSTLMELIRDAGIVDPFALCGGNCSCATCHVYIESDVFARLPAISAEEDELLDGSRHRRANSRLSCQVPYGSDFDGARIEVAPTD